MFGIFLHSYRGGVLKFFDIWRGRYSPSVTVQEYPKLLAWTYKYLNIFQQQQDQDELENIQSEDLGSKPGHGNTNICFSSFYSSYWQALSQQTICKPVSILIWICSIDTYAKKNIFNRATRDPGLRKLGFQRFVKSIWEAATKNMEQMAD